MRKLIGLILFLTITSQHAHSKNMDINTLKTVGCNFLASVGINNVKNTDLTVTYTGMATYNGTAVTALYVFTFNSRNGWVMVSADDRVKPVLAYSGTSVFDINNMAPATRKWIQGYEKQIAYVITNGLAAKPAVAEEWNDLLTATKHSAERTTSSVSPLLSTLWNQSPYYNDSCPSNALGTAVTGCVATAMAQVMKYWNWPAVGCGYHTYIDTPYGVQSANFGTTAYQWSSMPPMLFAHNPAVATLMYHAGVSVDMQYGYNGSGSLVNTMQGWITPCTEYALKANFHYKKSLHSLFRSGEIPGEFPGHGNDSITEVTWINDLKSELDANRPIIYVGLEDTIGTGHCWVCDGYDATNNFDFNWGWGGSSNGYFTVDNLAPPSLGSSSLNINQTVIVGIEPDSFPSNPGNIKMLSFINTSNSPAKYGGFFSVSAKIVNTDVSAFNGDICAQIFDSSNALAGTIQTFSGVSLAAGDSTATMLFSSPGMYKLVAGIYSVRLSYRPSGDTAWTPIANNGNYINFTNVSFYNDTDIEVAAPVSVNPGITLIKDQPVSVTVKLSDWASAINNVYEAHSIFHGNIRATLNNITDGSVAFTIQELTGQVIDTNVIDSFTFTNSALAVPGGTYLLEIQHQYNGTGNYFLTGSTYFCNPIQVHVVYPTSGTTINKSGNITIYPNPTSSEITVIAPYTIREVSICNLLGQTVLNTQHNAETLHLNVAAIPAGVYFIKVNNSEVMKFIKQ